MSEIPAPYYPGSIEKFFKDVYDAGDTNREDGWFNATRAAAYYGKKAVDWLKLQETKEYIAHLCEKYHVDEKHFIKTKIGENVGGIWFHYSLTTAFGRWLDVKFAVWCDDRIETYYQDDQTRPIPTPGAL